MIGKKILLFKKTGNIDNYGKNSYENGVERWVKILQKIEINNEDLSEDVDFAGTFLMSGHADVKSGDYFCTDLTVPAGSNPESLPKEKRYRVTSATRLSIGRRARSWGDLAI